MASSRINIEGFVAKNPETREAGSHTVTTVTVPVERGRVKDGQWVADTDKSGQKVVVWWEAEFWNEHGAQVAQEIQKGYLVRIEGEAWPRPFVKNDGTAGLAATITNPTVSIVVRRPSKRNNGQGGAVGGFGASSGPSGDPWSSGAGNGAQGGFSPEEEAPF